LLQRNYKKNSATIYTKDYLRSKEYRNGILESIYHNDGRVTKDESGYHYEYHIKDHLGNIRVTFVDDNNDGERACSSHTKWLVGEVKRNYRPGA
jgi:hypothetical protein